ncbi:DnaD domain-containing protein [Mesobacillus maritimus]|uniref:DnaD domain-containing protein n=1 Tax=Mesobacillus maritimus TaxID=1643336 RepID=UPI0020401615|nr:DnaD domain-containing protein [Mesobacillus maritimus]MCM3586535.1 DnaD domain-containing protein [Mesobacillus maritimus]MCM3669433.1 DnaD domain-containing protein [Mesobacillus maritimus]
MQKADFIQWLREGTITIPATLLTEYKNMHLTEQELVLLLQVIHFAEKGNEFPTPAELSGRMSVSVFDCTEILRSLIQKGFIEIIDGDSEEGIRYEKYSLDPLWEKLIDRFMINQKQERVFARQEEETDLYTCFENEFGRPLSPFECETLAMWMDDDHHDPIIIKAALREAVISGKLNFRYIDRILFEWKKNGIKTIEQAKSYGRKFRQHQNQQKPASKEVKVQSRPVPFYNWLEQ